MALALAAPWTVQEAWAAEPRAAVPKAVEPPLAQATAAKVAAVKAPAVKSAVKSTTHKAAVRSAASTSSAAGKAAAAPADGDAASSEPITLEALNGRSDVTLGGWDVRVESLSGSGDGRTVTCRFLSYGEDKNEQATLSDPRLKVSGTQLLTYFHNLSALGGRRERRSVHYRGRRGEAEAGAVARNIVSDALAWAVADGNARSGSGSGSGVSSFVSGVPAGMAAAGAAASHTTRLGWPREWLLPAFADALARLGGGDAGAMTALLTTEAGVRQLKAISPFSPFAQLQ